MPKVQEKSRLTFIRQTIFGCQPKAIYRCSCGVEKELHINAVKRELVRSCGCLQREYHLERLKDAATKHPLYTVWICMKGRCYCKTNRDYPEYGGRGVIVDQRWVNDFPVFKEWALSNGWTKGLQIDKDIIPKRLKIPALLYSPEMCCIATPIENANSTRNNKYITFRGEEKTIAEWSRDMGFPPPVVYSRIGRHKWTVEEALTTPIRQRKNRK